MYQQILFPISIVKGKCLKNILNIKFESIYMQQNLFSIKSAKDQVKFSFSVFAFVINLNTKSRGCISFLSDISQPIGNGFSCCISIISLGISISNQIEFIDLKSPPGVTGITSVDAKIMESNAGHDDEGNVV